MRKCSWCGKKEATENCVGGAPVYCEDCQRELLQRYGDKFTLEMWEKELWDKRRLHNKREIM